MRGEWAARTLVFLALVGAPLGLWLSGGRPDAVEMRGSAPDAGGAVDSGWSRRFLRAEVGVPLRLRLTSDDVVHGFAVGRTDLPEVEVQPGRFTDLTLRFEEPGIYTYYCTRWCGPGHGWMRGTVEVRRDGELVAEFDEAPAYERLGIDIDAPHTVDVELARPPSARRGADLAASVPAAYRSEERYMTATPHDTWRALRLDPVSGSWTDGELWDVVAFLWRSHVTDAQRRRGRALYVENCAACHGRAGDGDGAFAGRVEAAAASSGAAPARPAAFGEFGRMAGARGAVLDGKIRRGGMGTAMPAYATILSDEEIEALVAHLWSFSFHE